MGQKEQNTEEEVLKATEEENVEVNLDDLEKSWEDSKANVLALLGEEPSEEPVEKAESEEEEVEKAGDKKMEYNEEEEDEDEEDMDAKKSIEEDLDTIPEMQDVMDVEPWLREFARSIDERLQSLEKAIEETKTLQKATGKMFAAFGDLQKATAETVEKIGNEPVKSGSVIRRDGDRFQKSEEGSELGMSASAIKDRLLELGKAGKISSRDLTKAEGRLNRGVALPADLVELIKQGA